MFNVITVNAVKVLKNPSFFLSSLYLSASILILFNAIY